MEWYVLYYSFNDKKIKRLNIFNTVRFSNGVEQLLNEYQDNKEDFINKLTSLCRYCFWSKREYELAVGDLTETDINNLEKIDVFFQIEKNIPLLAYYILSFNKKM